MPSLYWILVVFLLVNLAVGLIRVSRGPTPADRMLAAQLFSTTGVAILLILAELTQRAALRDVALVFVLLAIVNTAVFVRHRPPPHSTSRSGMQ